MREIKFRAWSKEKKAFIAGFNMVNFHSYYNKGLEPSIFRYSTTWMLSEIELMQFTGLRDKVGLDIYEGDIVRLIEPNRLYTVEFIEFTFKLVHADPKLDRMIWGSVERLAELGWGIEVIGNIYEHT